MNKQHPKIQFTVEVETNMVLNFLDLAIERSSEGRISFSIYRKPTQTDHCIPSDSFNPRTHKMAAFRSFIHRLYSVPMSTVNFYKEVDIILQIAFVNGYTNNDLRKLFKRQGEEDS